MLTEIRAYAMTTSWRLCLVDGRRYWEARHVAGSSVVTICYGQDWLQSGERTEPLMRSLDTAKSKVKHGYEEHLPYCYIDKTVREALMPLLVGEMKAMSYPYNTAWEAKVLGSDVQILDILGNVIMTLTADGARQMLELALQSS